MRQLTGEPDSLKREDGCILPHTAAGCRPLSPERSRVASRAFSCRNADDCAEDSMTFRSCASDSEGSHSATVESLQGPRTRTHCLGQLPLVQLGNPGSWLFQPQTPGSLSPRLSAASTLRPRALSSSAAMWAGSERRWKPASRDSRPAAAIL